MNFIESLGKYLFLSAPFLLIGLFAAGLVHVFLKKEKIAALLGKNDFASIFKAALVGVPLPLCSCAVIPMAVTLKKEGASNGATSSFLISTPETGVDSIAVTYALMDFPMTIARPFAALATAVGAGLLQLFFNDDSAAPGREPASVSSCTTTCCPSESAAVPAKSLGQNLREAFKFGFGELSNDIAGWLTLGIVVGAVIDVLFPPEFFSGLNGFSGRLAMLAVGIPLYVCASATTPIAAGLVAKGMSPGVALILLLVGPATNVSNLLVMQKYIGKRGVVLNVVAVGGAALGLSYAMDWLYNLFAWPVSFVSTGHVEQAGPIAIASAAALAILLIKGIWIEHLSGYFTKKAPSCCG